MGYKDDLQHFTPPTIDNDLGRLTLNQITAQQRYTNAANAAYAWVRKNGFPAGYAESYKNIYEPVLKKANSAINFEDIYALDAAVSQTIWDVDTFGKLPIPTEVVATPPSAWAVKDYLVQSEEWPQFTTAFTEPKFIRMKESSQFTNGVGLQLGIAMGFQELAESQGGLWSPMAILRQEQAAKFGLQKSRRGFLGTSCQNAKASDGSNASGYGITGLYNYASAQTFEAGAGADDNIADQGDIEFTVKTALADLRKVYQPGSIVIVSSAACAAQMYDERDTYQQRLDSERVKEVLSIVTSQQNTTWGGWWVTDQLYASAPASGYDQMMVMKVGPGLMANKIFYPTQTLPMANKEYDRDIKENMIFANAIQVKKIDSTNNAVPITKAADLTSDNKVWIPEGSRIF